MIQPGRKFSVDSYRYGFNGKENDNEVKGEGNQQDYGMRIYDPRLGRFLTLDPLTGKYPELTPYQFASNSPIYSVDIDGLESDKKPDPSKKHSLSDDELFEAVKIARRAAEGRAKTNAKEFYNKSVGEEINKAIDVYTSKHSLTEKKAKDFQKAIVDYWQGYYNIFVTNPDFLNDAYFSVNSWDKRLTQLSKEWVVGIEKYCIILHEKKLREIKGAIVDYAVILISYLGAPKLKGGNGPKKPFVSTTQQEIVEIGEEGFKNAKWAQPGHSNTFSDEGIKRLGLSTIDEAITALTNKTMMPSQLPIDYVIRGNQIYILNTRSSVALTQAGIPRSQWTWNNGTGVADFEKRFNKQIKKSNGYTEVENYDTKKITRN